MKHSNLLFTFLTSFILCFCFITNTQATSFEVDIYKKDKAQNGTTLLADNFNLSNSRIIEINMTGDIVWQYKLPQKLARYTNPGFDVEKLSDNNIMFVLPGKGIYVINHNKEILWSHLDPKVSHDADLLANGNILYVYGNNDKITDAQVKEITPKGKLVWSWYAKDIFNKAPYNQINHQGWTHTNAVSKLKNGHTLISLRNFDCLVDLDFKAKHYKIIGKGFLKKQHDPEVLENGNILIANHDTPHEILEFNPYTNKIIWRFPIANKKVWPVRDANKLPNGNILITTTTALVEVTPQKEIVWRFRVKNPDFKNRREAPARGFYKAQRIIKE